MSSRAKLMSSQPEQIFRFRYDVPVRFRDLDPMGHAHHSLPLVYIEEARSAYWRDVLGRHGLDTIDYVLGEITVRFRQRIHFPGTLSVGVRVSRLGKSSFSMEYEIRDAQGELLVSAQTEQVMYDYSERKSKVIADEIRERIEAFE